MKKLALIVGLVLALAVFAASASADQSFTNTCGQNGNPLSPPHTPGVDLSLPVTFAYNGIEPRTGAPNWEVTFYSNCGTGGTLEYEIQHNVNGSYGDMLEWNGGDIDHQLTSPVTGDFFWDKAPNSLHACVHNDYYRVRVFWVNTSHQTVSLSFPSVTGAQMC